LKFRATAELTLGKIKNGKVTMKKLIENFKNLIFKIGLVVVFIMSFAFLSIAKVSAVFKGDKVNQNNLLVDFPDGIYQENEEGVLDESEDDVAPGIEADTYESMDALNDENFLDIIERKLGKE
jgi:hypothetical protein